MARIGLLIAGLRRVLQRDVVGGARGTLSGVRGRVRVHGQASRAHAWGFLAGWCFVVGKLASCAAMALTLRHLRRAGVGAAACRAGLFVRPPSTIRRREDRVRDPRDRGVRARVSRARRAAAVFGGQRPPARAGPHARQGLERDTRAGGDPSRSRGTRGSRTARRKSLHPSGARDPNRAWHRALLYQRDRGDLVRSPTRRPQRQRRSRLLLFSSGMLLTGCLRFASA